MNAFSDERFIQLRKKLNAVNDGCKNGYGCMEHNDIIYIDRKKGSVVRGM